MLSRQPKIEVAKKEDKASFVIWVIQYTGDLTFRELNSKEEQMGENKGKKGHDQTEKRDR